MSHLIQKLFSQTLEPFIGHNRDNGKPVCLSNNDLENHWHITGSTKTGKSSFLYLISLFLLHSDNGGIIIDPHGSLKENLEYYVSEFAPYLAHKVIFVDNWSEQLNYVVGLNPIRPDMKPDEVQYNALLLVESILKAFGSKDPSETPRISRQLYNTIVPLLYSKTSLVESQYFLDPTKESEREYLLQNTPDPMIKADWQLLSKLPPAKQLEQLEGLSNRLRPLLSNNRLRTILSAKSLDLAQVMEERKVVILNANPGNKAIVAEARLLGIMLLNSIYTVAKTRNWRNPYLANFFVVIDEFAQYVCHEVAYALEELRKYRCYFLLSHQHYAQLAVDNPYLAASVLGNCHSRLCFSVSYDDSELLSKQILLPDVNLLEVKYIQRSERYRPVSQLMELISESRATTSSESFSIGQSVSVSRSEGISEAEKDKEQWAANQKDSYVSRSNSSSQTQANTTNNSRSFGTAITSGISVNRSFVTTHERFIEESPTFFSLQEQVFRSAVKIVNQSIGQAYLKVLGKPQAIPLQLTYVQPVPFNDITTPVLLESLQQNLIFFHDCYQAVGEIQSNKKTTFPNSFTEPIESKDLFSPTELRTRKAKSIFSKTVSEE